jgi:purine-binding chemotaxis protein CheW
VISPTESAPGQAEADRADVRDQVLLVSVGRELFGVPLPRCREILEARSYTTIPGAGRTVCGLINLRGRLVTVLDLGVCLGPGAAADNPNHGILVMDHGDRRVGLAVDQVVRIVSVAAEHFPAGELFSAPIRLEEIELVGSGWVGSSVYRVLDPDLVFQPILG